MEPRHDVRRIAASASAVVSALTTVGYVVVIQQEDNDPFWEVFPWVMIMLIGTSAALASALSSDPRISRFSAIAATVILGALGMVAILSVGVGFILAAVLACVAAVSSAWPSRAS